MLKRILSIALTVLIACAVLTVTAGSQNVLDEDSITLEQFLDNCDTMARFSKEQNGTTSRVRLDGAAGGTDTRDVRMGCGKQAAMCARTFENGDSTLQYVYVRTIGPLGAVDDPASLLLVTQMLTSIFCDQDVVQRSSRLLTVLNLAQQDQADTLAKSYIKANVNAAYDCYFILTKEGDVSAILYVHKRSRMDFDAMKAEAEGTTERLIDNKMVGVEPIREDIDAAAQDGLEATVPENSSGAQDKASGDPGKDALDDIVLSADANLPFMRGIKYGGSRRIINHFMGRTYDQQEGNFVAFEKETCYGLPATILFAFDNKGEMNAVYITLERDSSRSVEDHVRNFKTLDARLVTDYGLPIKQVEPKADEADALDMVRTEWQLDDQRVEHYMGEASGTMYDYIVFVHVDGLKAKAGLSSDNPAGVSGKVTVESYSKLLKRYYVYAKTQTTGLVDFPDIQVKDYLDYQMMMTKTEGARMCAASFFGSQELEFACMYIEDDMDGLQVERMRKAFLSSIFTDQDTKRRMTMVDALLSSKNVALSADPAGNTCATTKIPGGYKLSIHGRRGGKESVYIIWQEQANTFFEDFAMFDTIKTIMKSSDGLMRYLDNAPVPDGYAGEESFDESEPADDE